MDSRQGILDPPPKKPRASSELVSRGALDRFVDDLWQVKSRWDGRWRKTSDYFMPTRSRLMMSDANRGDRENEGIYDNHGKRALNIMTSGVVNGMAPSTKPWFALSTGNKRQDEVIENQRCLTDWRDTALLYMERTKYYAKLGEQVRDGGMVATGAKMIIEDPDSDDLFRVITFPIGSFAIAENGRGVIDTFARQFTLTARQLVDEYGYDNCPMDVQQSWDNRSYTDEYQVRWLIYANPTADPGRQEYDPLARPFRECHWVHDAGNTGAGNDILRDVMGVDEPGRNSVLRVGGFHEFPISVIRWEKNEDDAYGTSCPGFEAYPVIKSLQAITKKWWNALEKGIDPPLVAGPSVKNKPVSLLPGRITIENEGANRTGLRPLHEVKINLEHVRQEREDLRNQIDAHMLVRHFLSLHLQADRPQMTAEEIIERRSEKLQLLGPILERHADDVFDPDIARIMNILIRASIPYWRLGMDGAPLSPPPESMGSVTLRVQYISDIAQSQKLSGLANLERHAAWVLQTAAQVPAAADGFDFDVARELHREYSGASPRLSRTEKEIKLMRMLRQQQQEAQQAAEAAPGLAKGARDLAEAPAGGDSVLARLTQAA